MDRELFACLCQGSPVRHITLCAGAVAKLIALCSPKSWSYARIPYPFVDPPYRYAVLDLRGSIARRDTLPLSCRQTFDGPGNAHSARATPGIPAIAQHNVALDTSYCEPILSMLQYFCKKTIEESDAANNYKYVPASNRPGLSAA